MCATRTVCTITIRLRMPVYHYNGSVPLLYHYNGSVPLLYHYNGSIRFCTTIMAPYQSPTCNHHALLHTYKASVLLSIHTCSTHRPFCLRLLAPCVLTA